MYMHDHAQLSWSKDSAQLAQHAAHRVHLLRRSASGLGLKIDPKQTGALYIPPREVGSKRHKENPERLAFHSGDLTVLPRNSIKWLGVVLDTNLSPLTQTASRAATTAATVGLNKRLSNTKNRAFLPSLAPSSLRWP